MTPNEHLDRLDQRRRYLEARITAKKSVGWETVYDQSERDALAWILGIVMEASAPVPEGSTGCQHPEEKRRNTTTIGAEPEYMCLACGETVKGVM